MQHLQPQKHQRSLDIQTSVHVFTSAKAKNILTNKRLAVGVTARRANRRNGDCRPGSYDVMTSSRMLALH